MQEEDKGVIYIKRVWSYLNGRKTIIGLVCYFVIGGVKQIGLLDESTADQLIKAAEVVIGVGVIHKIKKAI